MNDILGEIRMTRLMHRFLALDITLEICAKRRSNLKIMKRLVYLQLDFEPRDFKILLQTGGAWLYTTRIGNYTIVRCEGIDRGPRMIRRHRGSGISLTTGTRICQ